MEKQIAKHRDVYVRIGEVLHPGVKIVIGKFPRVFKEKVLRSTLREIKGEIVPTG